MKTGILFDLDGTLLNTLEDLLDATNFALRVHGCPERTLEELRRFVGNGAECQIRRSVSGNADPMAVLETYQAYYRTHCQIKTAAYPGVLAALEELKRDFPVAIVSNKPDPAVKILCREYFGDVFAMGEHPGCPRKPDPTMVRQAMKAIGADTCIYVGDSETDVATAKNAEVPCLSVTWGFRDRETLEQAGAVRFCDRAEDLPAILRDMIEKGVQNGQ